MLHISYGSFNLYSRVRREKQYLVLKSPTHNALIPFLQQFPFFYTSFCFGGFETNSAEVEGKMFPHKLLQIGSYFSFLHLISFLQPLVLTS